MKAKMKLIIKTKIRKKEEATKEQVTRTIRKKEIR